MTKRWGLLSHDVMVCQCPPIGCRRASAELGLALGRLSPHSSSARRVVLTTRLSPNGAVLGTLSASEGEGTLAPLKGAWLVGASTEQDTGQQAASRAPSRRDPLGSGHRAGAQELHGLGRWQGPAAHKASQRPHGLP